MSDRVSWGTRGNYLGQPRVGVHSSKRLGDVLRQHETAASDGQSAPAIAREETGSVQAFKGGGREQSERERASERARTRASKREIARERARARESARERERERERERRERGEGRGQKREIAST